MSYEELTISLTRWLRHDDPILRRTGTRWYLVDPEDAWELVGRWLTDGDLERFADLAVNVVTMPDPALELDPDRRWAASLYGKSTEQSAALRSGVVDTLALIAARGGAGPLAGYDRARDFVDSVVRRILHGANGDETGHTWKSIASLLPALAEASPHRFLEMVDVGLSGTTPLLARIFDPASEASFFGSPTHTGLLWALEALAWSKEYLPGAAITLARLARLDTDRESRWANRPRSSLREVFLPWRRTNQRRSSHSTRST